MSPFKLNLKRHREPMQLAKPDFQRRHAAWPSVLFRPWMLAISVVLIIALSTFLWTAYQPYRVSTDDGEQPGFLTQLTHLVTSGDRQLLGEAEDRVNILLLGIGGEGHEGAYLADTIMVVSLRPSTKSVAILSVPRDLAVPILDYGYRKINSALAFGEQENYPGGGERLMADVIEDVLGIPIHYYARVDFKGFVELVDLVGGVTVDVERSFVDTEYPTENYGYQTIRFSAGTQPMDGETALKFVRSRHGNNGEGSDFARAARQQKILTALKDNILSFGTLLNPKKISGIIDAVQENYVSNLELWEIMRLGKIVKEYDTENIITVVLDNSPEGLLKNQIGINGAYLLVPKAGDFSEIQFLAEHIFAVGAIEQEEAVVMVQNGSKEAGLAKAATEELALYGIASRLMLESAPTTSETLLYDFTDGAAEATIATITSLYGARVVPGQLEDLTALELTATETPDLLLVLGLDQVTPRQLSTTSR